MVGAVGDINSVIGRQHAYRHQARWGGGGAQPGPLGGSLTGQVGERYFGVYVPTRFGGTLTIKASSGTVEEIVGPDGRERGDGHESGSDQQGWYRFKVAGPEQDAPYPVETSFVQVGLSNRIPWNFYYWPT